MNNMRKSKTAKFEEKNWNTLKSNGNLNYNSLEDELNIMLSKYVKNGDKY